MLLYSTLLATILLPCMAMLFVMSVPVEYERRSKLTDKAKSALFKGQGTYYDVPGVGSCGKSDTDDELVVAVNREQMKNGVNPNMNPECEKHVVITGDQGKTATARIVDTCPTCKKGSLDMSREVCGDLGKGKCNIKWRFKNN